MSWRKAVAVVLVWLVMFSVSFTVMLYVFRQVEGAVTSRCQPEALA